MRVAATRWLPVLVALVVLGGAVAEAADVTLHQITFPERNEIDVDFTRTPQAPAARLEAEVRYREGQAQIELKFKDMKPALLFGGDVTCYVLWAVSRDGTTENLGELWVREANDKLEFATPLKAFALLVTGEAFPFASRPSELVLFMSAPSSNKKAPSDPFQLEALEPSPTVGMSSIANISWDSSKPVDVMQADKAAELAEREGAGEYAPQIMREATIALSQARNFALASSRRKEAIDYSRRSVTLFGEAIQLTQRRKQREALEREIEKRQQEMAALEDRARQAELQAQAASRQAGEAKVALAEAEEQKRLASEAVATTQAELVRLEQEKAALALEKQGLVDEREQLLAEKQTLEAEKQGLVEQQDQLKGSVQELSERAEKLRQEREQLSNRLQGALSQVADTRDSARGYIINLPDILFDLNEATLKHEAKVVIAKLSGILLIMPELNLRVEGHTDATGSEEYNQKLSEERADSVRSFLHAQGVDFDRMISEGYGELRPVADNSTKEGRQKNRRVEIIISEGTVAEAEP